MHRWRPWIELGTFLLVLAVLYWTSRERFFYDPGTFWHTKTGDLLINEGWFRADPFTFTQADREWIPTQWLAEIGMALAHRRLGLDGLLWTALLILAAFFAWLSGRFTQAGCHPLLTAVFLVLVFAASCYHYHARPHLVTIVFLGWLMGLLADVEAGRAPLYKLFWLVPFFVLWVNLHGGALGGMATFGLAGIGWGVYFLLGKESPIQSWRQVALLTLIGALCAGTAIVNPYGAAFLETWREILRQDLPKIISEHRPLTLDSAEGWAVLVLSAIYLFLLLGTLPRWPRVAWLLPLVWLLQAWFRIRNGPLFAVVAAVAIADLLPHCRWFLLLARRSDLYVPPPASAAQGRPQFSHIWLPFLAVPFLFPAPFRGGVELDREHWPVELIEPLRACLSEPGARIFNDDLFGGFLIYYAPKAKIFIDDRCELHGRDLLLEYVRVLRGSPDLAGEMMQQWVDRYRINLALTRADSSMARHLEGNSQWTLVAQTSAVGKKRVLLFKRR